VNESNKKMFFTSDEVMHMHNEEDQTRPHRCMPSTLRYIGGYAKIVYEEVRINPLGGHEWGWVFYSGNGRYYYRNTGSMIDFCPWCGERLDAGEYENFGEPRRRS
jgi:hypothetical protein